MVLFLFLLFPCLYAQDAIPALSRPLEPLRIQMCIRDRYGDEEFEGKVSLVYPTIDATTHTFPVEVKLANTHQRIRPVSYTHLDVYKRQRFTFK